MSGVKLYHNPQCSKSRGALEILRERGIEPELVEYLKQPPGREELEQIIELLPDPPSELVRRDKRFAELGLYASDLGSPARVVEVLQAHPELMQRPVVVRGRKARIARPSEKVLEIL